MQRRDVKLESPPVTALALPATNPNEDTTMKTYDTTDFYLTAFLIASGLPLQAHVRSEAMSTFTFSGSTKLNELVERYYGFQALVNPVAYGNAFRNLKRIMYSSTPTNDDKHMYHNQGHN
jgi:hypothetical protein